MNTSALDPRAIHVSRAPQIYGNVSCPQIGCAGIKGVVSVRAEIMRRLSGPALNGTKVCGNCKYVIFI